MPIYSAGSSAQGQHPFICKFCMHSANHSALIIPSGIDKPEASGSGAPTP